MHVDFLYPTQIDLPASKHVFFPLGLSRLRLGGSARVGMGDDHTRGRVQTEGMEGGFKDRKRTSR